MSRPTDSSATAPVPSTSSCATRWPSWPRTELAPDTAIPSERELMTTYDVSRATVRKAIDSLVADGLLQRIHGNGTFVARPRLESRLHLASFSQDMRRRGLTPSTRLLDVELDRPPAEVAAALGARRRAPRPGSWTGSGSPTASRSRSRTAGTPRRSCPASTGTTSAARSTSCSPTSSTSPSTAPSRRCGARPPTACVASRLDAPVNTPLLVFRRVSRAGGRPLEHVVSRYRGDRYQIHMSLGRDDIGPSSTTEGNQQ